MSPEMIRSDEPTLWCRARDSLPALAPRLTSDSDYRTPGTARRLEYEILKAEWEALSAFREEWTENRKPGPRSV
jgi:hypothetical protein